MALAIGGEFYSFGVALRDFTIQCGLRESMTLIDIGCGSGRLAYALKDMNIHYVGTDVVEKLLEYARKLCGRADWRFEIVSDLRIPVEDASADMAVAFSVFTHLRPEEIYIYLMEAKRILKPNGLLIFTFLDFSQPHHWIIFEQFVDTVRNGVDPMHVDQFIDKPTLSIWAEHVGFEIRKIFDGSEKYIKLSKELVRDDGTRLKGECSIGQSACVMRKK